MRDTRPLLHRILNPGVPQWVAVPCNVLAVAGLVLLIIDPANNLLAALALLGLADVGLYGIATVMRKRKR